MKNIQTIFKSKQEKIAEFVAYLTNSVISRDEKGNLILVSKSEMDEKISQMLEKKDFISAGELIESAKKLLRGPVRQGEEVVSKSIRLPFITYLKFHEVSQKNNMSLSDVIRITSIPAMKNKLDEFRDIPAVNQEKLKGLNDLLKTWKDKKPTSPNKEYFPEYRDYIGDEIANSFEKLIEFSICNECKKIPKEMMKGYIRDHGDFSPLMDIDLRVKLKFDPQSDLFKLTICLANAVVFTQYYEFKKDNIDYELHNEFDEVLGFEYGDHDEVEDQLTTGFIGSHISGTLRIENNNLFFDGVDIGEKHTLKDLIYEKITNERCTDSDIAESIKQLQEALARNDYDTASQLNEKLAKFQLASKIAGWYGDIISSVIEETNVITFTIPKLLLMLWEATRGDRSIPEFLERNILEV